MARTVQGVEELSAIVLSSRDAERILMQYVAPVVEEILRKHIEQDIYGTYYPTRYRRSYSLTANVRSKMISDNVLFVTSTAVPNLPHAGWHSSGDGDFLYMLERGDLGWWRKGFPRPAISNAQREVDSSALVEAAKQTGIRQVMKK